MYIIGLGTSCACEHNEILHRWGNTCEKGKIILHYQSTTHIFCLFFRVALFLMNHLLRFLHARHVPTLQNRFCSFFDGYTSLMHVSLQLSIFAIPNLSVWCEMIRYRILGTICYQHCMQIKWVPPNEEKKNVEMLVDGIVEQTDTRPSHMTGIGLLLSVGSAKPLSFLFFEKCNILSTEIVCIVPMAGKS